MVALLTRISMLALVLLVSACIYVPPVWDIGDEIYGIDFIEPGVTTKDQVRGRLGEPDRSREGNVASYFKYCGKRSGGGIVGYGVGGEIAPTYWEVKIDFDENDVVSSVQAYDTDRLECEIYFQVLDKVDSRQRENFSTQLTKACLGSKPAQYLVGQYYDRGEGVDRNRVEAFKWYSLAQQEWPEAIQYFKDKLRQEMTSFEITEAERLAAEWKPNQAGCDQGVALSKN